jgi:hypothetical protein
MNPLIKQMVEEAIRTLLLRSLLPYKPRNSPDKILLCLFIRFIAYMFKDLFIDICIGLYGNNDAYIFFSGEFLGLYGNNDGIKDNDLISRNGTLINSNASMIDIHGLVRVARVHIPLFDF